MRKQFINMFKFSPDDGSGGDNNPVPQEAPPAASPASPSAPLLGGENVSGSPTPAAGAVLTPAVPAATLSFDKLLNDKGEFVDNWQNALPESLREKPWLKNFKTLDGLVQSYDQAQAVIGKKGLIAPTAKSTPEEREQFYRSLGKPAEAKGYKLDVPEGLPEGIFNEAWTGNFQSMAHKANLSAEQAATLWNEYFDFNKNEITAVSERQQQQQAVEIDALRKEWGGAFAQQLDLANRVVRTHGLQEVLAKKGLSNDVEMVKLFAKIGAGMSEDKMINGNSIMIPASAKAEADKVMHSEAYMKPDHAEHDIAVKKYNELMRQAYPG